MHSCDLHQSCSKLKESLIWGRKNEYPNTTTTAHSKGSSAWDCFFHYSTLAALALSRNCGYFPADISAQSIFGEAGGGESGSCYSFYIEAGVHQFTFLRYLSPIRHEAHEETGGIRRSISIVRVGTFMIN